MMLEEITKLSPESTRNFFYPDVSEFGGELVSPTLRVLTVIWNCLVS